MKELLSLLQQAGDIMDMHDSTVYWFRGHSDCNYQLIPSVFRQLKDNDGNTTGYYDEDKLLKEFIRIHPEAREKHRDNLELLTYAQHYGLPTRLLDWTTNLLVAILFACKDKIDKDAHLVIYKPNLFLDLDFDPDYIDFKTELYGEFPTLCSVPDDAFFIKKKFNEYLSICDMDGTINGIPSDENGIYINGYQPLELISSPEENIYFKDDFSTSIPYQPKVLNERLKLQHGCFTLHGGKISNGRILLPIYSMEEEQNTKGDRVQKVLIQNELKPLILKQLLKLGINEASIFPELEYQTKSILSNCITKTAT
ncbi:FRG domain-containing protein [Shewanella sp. NKUCC05_KAH]|uniref:FRG domain-containing protein n=1 Tax=Shewanella sp. NKUCC05_KAH TaxID=2842126 RepID=UPI001C5B4D5B|nr:FRG domain-containing protein [Shewanella sp. NKUCC05_KAH]MBW3525869.1 FRG domain-containing protein [Shewanella sp. NKUCC05_KAH]